MVCFYTFDNKNIPKKIFLDASKSFQVYEYFEPYERRQLRPFASGWNVFERFCWQIFSLFSRKYLTIPVFLMICELDFEEEDIPDLLPLFLHLADAQRSAS